MNKKLTHGIWLHICNRKGCEWTSKKEFPNNCQICKSPIWNRDDITDRRIKNKKLNK